jgi:pantetheine-phosphate adenylyltransferase
MAKKKIGIYAGSFDLYTNGHGHILKRALALFDEVVIVVATSPAKRCMFTKEQRVGMLQKLYSSVDRIKIDSWDSLIVDYAKKNDIQFLVRGLRPTGDFEIEFQMASMNSKLYNNIETVFLMTGGKHYFVSSSLVKEIWSHEGDISQFVPESILEDLKKIKGSESI